MTVRSMGSKKWFVENSAHAAMPVAIYPPLTTRDVARQAGAVLPAVRVRRLVFWRHFLHWEKAAEAA